VIQNHIYKNLLPFQIIQPSEGVASHHVLHTILFKSQSQVLLIFKKSVLCKNLTPLDSDYAGHLTVGLPLHQFEFIHFNGKLLPLDTFAMSPAT
jgi:hypothetical protein